MAKLHSHHWTGLSSRKLQLARHFPRLCLLLLVGYEQPWLCNAALSISSGYESFLTEIRRRIVCEEGDIYDEAVERGRARACDSMVDGPFCRGLPNSRKVPRHRPFTVDSIVPEHLFGDTRSASSTDDSPAKLATSTLNKFLEEYHSLKVDKSKHASQAIEGRLQFEELSPLSSEALFMFSRGLPEGTLATFTGMWQTLPLPHVIDGQRRSIALRLNGAHGILKFSRPVVVRHLMVRPPVEFANMIHKMQFRARKAGKEIWRHEYSFDAQHAEAMQPICRPGDVVSARFKDGRFYLAVLVAADAQYGTVRWVSDGVTNVNQYRYVTWQNMRDTSGRSCGGGARGGRGLRTMGLEAGYFWLDMARRVKTVDEIAFLVPAGADGWLLSDVVVAAPRPTGGQAGDDPVTYNVQVFPGLLTAIVETSQAAVVYNADDMLERDLQIRQGPANQTLVAQEASPKKRAESEGEANARLSTSLSHSVEGLKQFVRGLFKPLRAGVPATRLPPHITFQNVLENLETLVLSMREPTRSQVKAFGHFEQYFAMHWETMLNLDFLEVAFERWRRDPAVQEQGRDVFYVGQAWTGTYHCSQGPTSIKLQIKKVFQRGEVSAEKSQASQKNDDEDETNTETQATHTFQPGTLGVEFEQHTGVVKYVQAAGQAHTKGIKKGYQFLTIGSEPYSYDALLRAVKGDLDYEVTFEVRKATSLRGDYIEGELSFWVDGGDTSQLPKKPTGSYMVSGELDLEGRTLALEPVPDSWIEFAANFVMVGLHGVVTPFAQGLHRFAGSVPSYGCDSFEIESQVPIQISQDPIQISQEAIGDPHQAVELLKKSLTPGEEGGSAVQFKEFKLDDMVEELEGTGAESAADLGDLVRKIAAQIQAHAKDSQQLLGQAHEVEPRQKDLALDHRTRSQNIMLKRLVRVLDEARTKWRAQLRAIVTDKKQASTSSTETGGVHQEIVASAVQQLLKAVGAAGQTVNLQMDDLQALEDGNTIVLKFGDAEVQVNR